MKLLVQRVLRATVEVDSFIQGRISAGLVLYVGLCKGDTVEKVQQLATKALKLNLWPDLLETEKQFATNVVQNGFEVLVVAQHSLCASFPQLSPDNRVRLDEEESTKLLDAFVSKLQEEYQEEMIVIAPFDKDPQVEAACEGFSFFELGAIGSVTTPAHAGTKDPRANLSVSGILVPLEPNVVAVTKALVQIPQLAKNQAAFESRKIFSIFGQEKFQVALSEAELHEADAFAEALEGAAHFFTKKQQEQIQSWTGLTITAAPANAETAFDEGDEDAMSAELEKRLSELKDEVEGKPRGTKRAIQSRQVKNEGDAEDADMEEGEKAKKIRPDWKARAAPETPATASAREWVANRRVGAQPPWAAKGQAPKGKSKGKGRGAFRNWGIASLDESSRLHGGNAVGYQFAQHARYSDHELRFGLKDQAQKSEKGIAIGNGHAAPLGLPKGTPTVAPMCPAAPDAIEEL